MPTGYEVDAYRALTSIAGSLRDIAKTLSAIELILRYPSGDKAAQDRGLMTDLNVKIGAAVMADKAKTI